MSFFFPSDILFCSQTVPDFRFRLVLAVFQVAFPSLRHQEKRTKNFEFYDHTSRSNTFEYMWCSTSDICGALPVTVNAFKLSFIRTRPCGSISR
jgi:hypothetical protein